MSRSSSRRTTLLALVGLALLSTMARAAPFDPSLAKRREARIRELGPLVTEVRFVGNETFAEKELVPYMAVRESGFFRVTYFRPRDLAGDLANIERFYETQGFLEAEVETEDLELSGDSLAIELLVGVYEGPRWTVSEVTFSGQHAVSETDLAGVLSVRPGGSLLSTALEDDRRGVLEAYARRSFLDARVRQDVVRDDVARTAAVRYQIVEREPAVIKEIVIEGADKTRGYVVRRELSCEPGESFDFEKIGRSQAAIYRTGLFHSVWIEPSPADTGKPAKRLLVRVSERPSGAVDASFGYAALDGLEVGAGALNRNVQGQAIEAGLEGRLSELTRTVEASVGDPWFIGRRVAVKGTGRYARSDEESFVAETVGASVIATKKIGEAVALEGGYETERTVVLEASEGSGDAGTNYTTDIVLGATLDTRDDILNGKRGVLARAGIELASSRLGGTNNFARYELEARGFKRIGHGRVIALTARCGWVRPGAGEGEVPVNERYLAGGEGSVRGFPRNSLGPGGEDGQPTGGHALAVLRGELRLPVWRKLGLVGFVDAGQAFDDIRAAAFSGLAVGAGGGLRYETRLGVLRVDVAGPVTDGGIGQYYIGIGQAF